MNTQEINFLGKLNPEQKKAVKSLEGPLLILAGAGTGKTRVINYRIANLLKNGVDGTNILALTFTNKAAREMQERVQNLVGIEAANKLFIGTMHSFCLSILRKEIKNTNLLEGFTIADEVDQKAIYKQILAEMELKDNKVDVNKIRGVISKAKNNLQYPKEFQGDSNDFINSLIAKVYPRYQELLKLQNMVDFDDLLFKAVELLRENEEVANRYRWKYRYILVDEFQDTNLVQFELLKLLSLNNENLCVVGDDDQSIYGWRGAKVENIMYFPKTFPNTKVIKLQQNYRSTNNILKAANSFISGNEFRYSKQLWSGKDEGEKVFINELTSDIDETEFIADEITGLIYGDEGFNYSDIAILYRSNHQSRLFEKTFRKQNIPYRLVGSRSFYERREIRDAVAYLKILENPNDTQSLLRVLSVPPRGIGAKTVSQMKKYKEDSSCLTNLYEVFGDEEFLTQLNKKAKESIRDFYNCLEKWRKKLNEEEENRLSENVQNFFSEIGFLNGFQKMYKNYEEAESRRENVFEFLNAIAQLEEEKQDKTFSLSEFLESFALYDDNDKVDEEEGQNSVTLLTVHAAKGLEFPCIFITGMEQEIFPHSRALESRDIDEERRLFYVALTRAKEKLYITYANNRYKFGRSHYQFPSEFISEIPEEITDSVGNSNDPIDEDVVSNAFASFFDQFDYNRDE